MDSDIFHLIIYAGLLLLSFGLIVLGNWLDDKIRSTKQERKAIPNNGDSPALLGIGNSIGLTMLGNYEREVESLHPNIIKKDVSKALLDYLETPNNVGYCFFVILYMPIIPLGCFAYRMTRLSYKGTTKQTSYRFYGKQKGYWMEILHVYIVYWSYAILITAAIATIYYLLSVFNIF